MSEFSRNIDTEPMRKKDRARVQATRTVLAFLTERHRIHDDKPRIPGEIGSVLLPHEYEQPELPLTPHLTQPVIERTDAAQLAQTMVQNQHGWDSMGNYY